MKKVKYVTKTLEKLQMIKIRDKTTRCNYRLMRLSTSTLRLKILAAAVENKGKSCKQVVSKHVTKKILKRSSAKSEITLHFSLSSNNDCLGWDTEA